MLCNCYPPSGVAERDEEFAHWDLLEDLYDIQPLSEFYASTNPDGTIEPHWVEGQREIPCSVEVIKQMIENANRGILMELDTTDAIRADRAKLAGLVEELIKKTTEFYESGKAFNWTESYLAEKLSDYDDCLDLIRTTPIGDAK